VDNWDPVQNCEDCPANYNGPGCLDECFTNTSGYTECQAVDGIGGPYIIIPERTFYMGCNENANGPDWFCWDSEVPQHEVRLSKYGMDKYEVTQLRYKDFIDATGYPEPGMITWEFDPDNYPNYPVVAVTWVDARTYCQWLGGDLPTEAQWEHAARGPMNSPTADYRVFPWGNTVNGCNEACIDGCCTRSGTRVGSYPAGISAYGFYDLIGNVEEHVYDWYAYYTAEFQQDPTGPEEGTERVYRGANWNSSEASSRTSRRLGLEPDMKGDGLGFRCARPVH
jgi:formylglycine-generating enzyme required for sulfatase activity